MKHIFVIDPLEKLVVKKDSTLLLAHTLSQTEEVYVSFEKDWFFRSPDRLNKNKYQMSCYQFDSIVNNETFYVEKFETTQTVPVDIDDSVTIHMRKDPPFDRTYLHMCWILQEVEKTGAKVINNPSQLLMLNEKLIAYQDKNSIPTIIARSAEVGIDFVSELKSNGYEAIILKPLDLYQGIGVKKYDINSDNFKEIFEQAVIDYQGVYVAQPYLKSVEAGEIRSVFYAGKHIGSIIKIPPKGSYLANIAQGAAFHAVELSPDVFSACEQVSKELDMLDVPFCAFDILDNKISEINITCPGLLVEVSNALNKNVCLDICEQIKSS